MGNTPRVAAKEGRGPSTARAAVRSALENLKATYQGLIKTYNLPFTPENHDALGPNDYIMVRYEGDKVVPVE